MGGYYRAYIVDEQGHFIGVHEIVADAKASAIEAAERLTDGHDLELWIGAHLVRRISRTGRKP